MRNIFTKSFILLTASLLELAKADFCLDDQTFLYNSWSCANIGDSQALSDTLCEIDRVAISCPLSCSLCCEDSKGNVVKFRKQNDLWGTCRWVSKRQKRIERYCGTEVEYITAAAYDVPLNQLIIESGSLIQFDKLCPETCNVLWCPLPTSPPTYVNTPGGPTPAPSVQGSNIPSNSMVPTPVLTASPTCFDDPDFQFEALFRPDVMLSCDFILKHSEEERDLIRQHRYCCGDNGGTISQQCCKSCSNVDCPTSAPTASPVTYQVSFRNLHWVGTKKDFLRGKELNIEFKKALGLTNFNLFRTRVLRRESKLETVSKRIIRNIQYIGLEEEDQEVDILIEMWLVDTSTRNEIEGSRVSKKLSKPAKDKLIPLETTYAYYTMAVNQGIFKIDTSDKHDESVDEPFVMVQVFTSRM